jgi:hypothetical protein
VKNWERKEPRFDLKEARQEKKPGEELPPEERGVPLEGNGP